MYRSADNHENIVVDVKLSNKIEPPSVFDSGCSLTLLQLNIILSTRFIGLVQLYITYRPTNQTTAMKLTANPILVPPTHLFLKHNIVMNSDFIEPAEQKQLYNLHRES